MAPVCLTVRGEEAAELIAACPDPARPCARWEGSEQAAVCSTSRRCLGRKPLRSSRLLSQCIAGFCIPKLQKWCRPSGCCTVFSAEVLFSVNRKKLCASLVAELVLLPCSAVDNWERVTIQRNVVVINYMMLLDLQPLYSRHSYVIQKQNKTCIPLESTSPIYTFI